MPPRSFKAKASKGDAPSTSVQENERVHFTALLKGVRDAQPNSAGDAHEFPANLSTAQRAFIHGLATKFGLVSKSKGKGEARAITVSQPRARTAPVDDDVHIPWVSTTYYPSLSKDPISLFCLLLTFLIPFSSSSLLCRAQLYKPCPCTAPATALPQQSWPRCISERVCAQSPQATHQCHQQLLLRGKKMELRLSQLPPVLLLHLLPPSSTTTLEVVGQVAIKQQHPSSRELRSIPPSMQKRKQSGRSTPSLALVKQPAPLCLRGPTGTESWSS
jgi:hypothetical protein